MAKKLTRRDIIELIKDKEPNEITNSSHIVYEKFKIDNNIIECYFAISGSETYENCYMKLNDKEVK